MYKRETWTRIGARPFSEGSNTLEIGTTSKKQSYFFMKELVKLPKEFMADS